MMLCGVSVVFNSLGDVLGLMSCKRSSENRQVLVGFQSTEAFGCLHHAGGGPAQRHPSPASPRLTRCSCAVTLLEPELVKVRKAAATTAVWARSRVGVYHIRDTPVFVDHVGGVPGRHNRALLPGADPAQMFTGEVEGAVRRIEERVLVLLTITESRGEAEAVRNLDPGNCYWPFELPAPTRMQTLDCRARYVELFAQRSACYFVRLPADRIGAEQNPLRRKEAVAGIPDQRGRTCCP